MTTYYFAHDDSGVQFCDTVWELLDLDGVLVRDCYVYTHYPTFDFPDTKETIEEFVCDCKDVPATEWLKEQQDGLESEIECRHSTWETKEGEYEAEIAELKEEVDRFRKSPAYAAVIWERDCLKEEIAELKEKLEAATAREDSMFQTLNKKRNEESEWAQKKIVELKEEIAMLYRDVKRLLEAKGKE